MGLRKAFIILGLAGVLAVLAVAGTALAQTPTPAPTQTGANYHDLFLDKLAAALGTTRESLNSAMIQARNETVDQAVKDGKLTQEQADRIKSTEGFGMFGFPGHGFRGGPHGAGFMKLGPEVRDAVAQALGMTPEELTNQLRSGKTLGELAQGNEQAVKDAIKNAVRPQLDQAVQSGRMTKEQATQILDKIQNSDLNSLGGPWHMGQGRYRGGNGQQKPAPTQQPSTGPAFFRGVSL